MDNPKKASRSLAIFVKSHRTVLDMTQEKLAERSGIDYKHIQNLESKTRINDPRYSTLVKLADALGVPVSDIVKKIEEEQVL
jgi:transcriptional regulator with XRE-family HTH domain